jgi:hypothetical protein
VKAVASKEEVALAAVSRLAAWWLGENANYATGQFAWRPLEKDPMLRPHSAAEIRWAAGAGRELHSGNQQPAIGPPSDSACAQSWQRWM